MSSFALKISAVLLLFAGEALCIYAEVAAGSTAVTATARWGSHFSEFLLFILSGVLLLGGYALGTRAFGDIWVVTVISVTSILFLEPLIVYALFRQAPGTGPAVGLALGGLGLVAALF